jgi:outer membrane protein TolC
MIGKNRALIFFLSCCCLVADVYAEQEIPDPLSLDQAIRYADDLSYASFVNAQAEIEQAQAELSRARSPESLQAELMLQAAVIEPSPFALDQDKGDHLARLSLRRQLYDFGRSDLQITSASDNLASSRENLDYLKGVRQIEIARQFFNVILSDLKYAWDNEAMAIAYVNYDKAQENHALNRISDVALLEAENDYQQIRYQRYISENEQRASRALLAEILNQPGSLPSSLKKPELQYHTRELPGYEQLLQQAMQNNVRLKQLSTRVESAHKMMQAARQQQRPTLDAQVEVSEYARDAGSYDDWRASVNLRIPLLETEAMKSEASRYRSQWLKQRAMLLEEQSRVRQRVLRLWQNISLLKTRREQVQISQDFRELALDRSRALYEMEATTNLGDAMVAISEVRFRQAETDFQLALAWMELNLLLGQTVYDES